MTIHDRHYGIASDIEQMSHNLDDLTVELTPTNACNCNCKYCFEQDHSQCTIDEKSQEKQISLLIELCENFDPLKFNEVHIVFWGGEPMLNSGFIEQVVEATSKYKFVTYMMYSNGTLFNAYEDFIKNPIIANNNYRFEVQLSYDGSPHNEKMRGYNEDDILKTARLLFNAGFKLSFKATLTFTMIKHFADAWQSYKKLYDEFGDNARYSPTLDTTNFGIDDESKEEWKKQVIEVAKLEYKFIQKHGHSLISWYNPFYKSKCSCKLDYHAAINTNGDIYLCHGCFYSKHKDKFKLGSIDNIKTLYKVLQDNFSKSKNNFKCMMCSAMFCNVCHISCVDPNDYVNDWHMCKSSNQDRCWFFKYFSYIFNLLTCALIDSKMLLPLK